MDEICDLFEVFFVESQDYSLKIKTEREFGGCALI